VRSAAVQQPGELADDDYDERHEVPVIYSHHRPTDWPRHLSVGRASGLTDCTGVVNTRVLSQRNKDSGVQFCTGVCSGPLADMPTCRLTSAATDEVNLVIFFNICVWHLLFLLIKRYRLGNFTLVDCNGSHRPTNGIAVALRALI